MPDQTELNRAEADFLSEPDSFNLHQYLHMLHRRESTEPEMRLMLVLLQDALRCLDKYALTSVQFFFNETKRIQQVRSFQLRDSLIENPMVDVGKRPPYLPQD